MPLLVESYAQFEDVCQIYGRTNVNKWADLDSRQSQVDIDARIKWALETSYAELHDRLRGGPLALPVASPYPRTLVRLQAMMTGLWLYESRGVQDADESKHQLMWHRKEVSRLIMDIHAGKLRFDTSDAPGNIPIVVLDRSADRVVIPGFEKYPTLYQ